MHGGGGHREGYWSWGIEGSDSADPMHVPAPAGGGMGGEREGGHRRVNEKWEAGREEGCEKGSREVEGSSVRCNRGRLVREDLAMERRTADRDKQFLSGLGLTRRGAAAALLLVALVFASSADARESLHAPSLSGAAPLVFWGNVEMTSRDVKSRQTTSDKYSLSPHCAASALTFPASSPEVNCYVHQKSGGLIKGTDPTNSQDCGWAIPRPITPSIQARPRQKHLDDRAKTPR